MSALHSLLQNSINSADVLGEEAASSPTGTLQLCAATSISRLRHLPAPSVARLGERPPSGQKLALRILELPKQQSNDRSPVGDKGDAGAELREQKSAPGRLTVVRTTPRGRSWCASGRMESVRWSLGRGSRCPAEDPVTGYTITFLTAGSTGQRTTSDS